MKIGDLFFKNLEFSKPNTNEFEITIFGPGYGESIVIHVPGLGWGVIDSCRYKFNGEFINPALEYLLLMLSPEYPKLEFVSLSHPHEDHYLGLDKILTEYPGGIKRVCRYDGDGVREFRQYLASICAVENTRPTYASIFKAFKKAVDNGASLRRLGELSTILDNDVILDNRSIKIKIISISPSAESISKYVEHFMSCLPKEGEPLQPLEEIPHNLISNALLIQIGNLQVVLGGDLEKGSKRSGWSGVLANEDIPKLSASIVKVSHHGGESGYHEDAWKEHIQNGKPIALITPYCKGHKTPNNNDISRIMHHANTGITNTFTYKNNTKKHYKRDVSTAIGRITRNFNVIDEQLLGILRVRMNLDGEIITKDSTGTAQWL